MTTKHAAAQRSAQTVLGIEGSRFTLNGRPTFLLGISYYGALGAPLDLVERDLEALRRRGFNWLRVWATWRTHENDVSAVDATGKAREPYLGRLRDLVAACDRRGLVVDVTLTRGKAPGAVPDLPAHRTAVRTLIDALRDHRNLYLDLANERDVGDARFVPIAEVRALRAVARERAPWLPVTASFGGHDLDEAYLRKALIDGDLDFVAPHRPRHAGTAEETQRQTEACRAALRTIGRTAPIHYQEPFRRGYTQWQPTAKDFATDLEGARAGGAAGWCFHNGDTRGVPDNRPRRSFDLRDGLLFDQLDAEERRFTDRNLVETKPSARALAPLPGHPTALQDARGKPVVLVGAYTWGAFSDIDFDFVRYLDHHKRLGLNVARVWLWWGCEEITTDPIPARHVEPFLRPGPGKANDGRPKYDLSRFNPAFFARLDTFCQAARERGVQLQLIAMDAWMLKHADLWRLHAFHKDNNVNDVDGDPARTGTGTDGRRGFCSLGNPGAMAFQKALVRRIVETTNRFDNVHYEIANENTYSDAWELSLCAHIADVEGSLPRRHLVMRRDLPLHSDVVQRWEPALVRRGMLARRSLRQPLIFDTDWVINKNDDQVRAAMWTALVSGGHFDYMDDSLDFRLGRPFQDRRAALHAQIGHAAAFLKRIRAWEMTPDDTLVASGAAYAMASADDCVAYSPKGGRLILAPPLKGDRVTVRWFDPRTGKDGPTQNVAVRDGKVAVAAPDGSDAVLRVTRRGGR